MTTCKVPSHWYILILIIFRILTFLLLLGVMHHYVILLFCEACFHGLIIYHSDNKEW